MLGCELEKELYDFIQENKNTPEGDFSDIPGFSFIKKDELYELGPQLITQKPGSFRRIIRIDFSAAAQLHSDTYNKVVENVTNAFMTYWANRVTLVKFGRRYCTNFFKNLAFSQNTTPIQNYFGTINKPIIVFGAGESLAQGIEEARKDCYVICADTALQPLVAQGIVPDAVFIEEAQNVISKCFIGTQGADIHIFAGLSSLHAITRYFKPEQLSFFTTEFTQAKFIDRFEQNGILPPKNKPFGSVGITAFYYALLFRKDKSIPIKTYGLDFSYSAGRTHTRGAMADNARFFNSSRIKNDANYAAAYNEPAFKKNDKMFTTPIMVRYEQILESLCVLDDIGVPELVEGPQNIAQILQDEADALQELKSLLTGEKKLPAEQLEAKLTQLIQEREYLYLHFPDGHRFAYTQSFLNRVRFEIDYFLKIIRW